MVHTVRSTLTDAQIPELERCERRIGYDFHDKSLLRAALTHASGAQHRLASNERLEFLGDAILGAVVCELLYRQYPDYLEGDLTKIKSVVVSRQTCAKISEALGLAGVSDPRQGHDARIPACRRRCWPTCSNRWSAAIYLDGGDPRPREFIQRFMGPEIELAAAGELGGNYKSLLQQTGPARKRLDADLSTARRKRPRPQQVLQDLGPDRPHALSAGLGPQQERSRATRPPATPWPSSTASRCRFRPTDFRRTLDSVAWRRRVNPIARPQQQAVGHDRHAADTPSPRRRPRPAIDIRPAAPTAPAAIGINRTLYRNAQARFCLIVRSVARASAIVRATARRSSPHDHDVGRFDRDVRARADGDSQIGRGQRRRIVDAVANHGHDLARVAQLPQSTCLFFARAALRPECRRCPPRGPPRSAIAR